MWSSSSSPPARNSMSRTTKGRALGPIVTPTASAARYSTRQLTSRQVHCAHLGRFNGPHARGRAAHRRRRRPRCPEQQWVGPLGRLHRLYACHLNRQMSRQGHCAVLRGEQWSQRNHSRSRLRRRRWRRVKLQRVRHAQRQCTGAVAARVRAGQADSGEARRRGRHVGCVG